MRFSLRNSVKPNLVWMTSGLMIIAALAACVAGPLGLAAAVYLSEFASTRVREVVKPTLELLSGVPTVVYGFFALLFVTRCCKPSSLAFLGSTSSAPESSWES